MKPCVRCLNKYPIRKPLRNGKKITMYIFQCEECGFNVTSRNSWIDAEYLWNEFKVWKLVKKNMLDKISKQKDLDKRIKVD